MSPEIPPMTSPEMRFPRVSGDEPNETFRNAVNAAFSPRERG